MFNVVTDQAYRFFVEEATELLNIIESGLLELRENRSKNTVHQIMRAAHSIKGGAASVGLNAIRQIAHRLEDFFKALYHDEVILDAQLEHLLLVAFDCLKNPLTQQINQGGYDESTALAQAEPIFQQIENLLGDVLKTQLEYIPSSADLGVDITSSIFEVDVHQEIERLQNLIQNNNGTSISTELTAIAEMFAGFSELLGLPGFGAIASSVITALQLHPDQELQIAQIALKDFVKSENLVKSGDRTSGGEPSPELLTYIKSTDQGETLTDSTLTPPANKPEVISSISGDFSGQAYQFFREEARELLNTIESELLLIKEEKTALRIHEIMRAAHSIKGGAASVGLEAIAVIAHRLEDFFKALYDESIIIDTELESLLLLGFDCLKEPLLYQLETGSIDEKLTLERCEPVFAALEQQLKNALTATQEYIPSSQDLGVDIASSIFEVDVAQEIAKLENTINTPDAPIAAELRATAEVFAGFGELLGLPGFTALANQISAALELHPSKELEIARVAVNDFKLARQLVLGGDRISGGEPSPELLNLTLPPAPGAIQPPELQITLSQEDDIKKQAYQFFIEEAVELLDLINKRLPDLKLEKTQALVHELMRAAHSIKGGAASVGLEPIRALAYRLEKMFKALFCEDVVIDEELYQLLEAGFICVRDPLLQQIETGSFDEVLTVSQGEIIFAQIETRLAAALEQSAEYIPSSADLGVDIASSIFEVDVAQELERLERVLTHPGQAPISGELRAMAEVFAGFGELLGLPGFGAIATQTLAALELHPDQEYKIATIALKDFHKARQLVLEGDRQSGGEPSPELLAYTQPDYLPITEAFDSPQQIFSSSDLGHETTHSLEQIFSLDQQENNPISDSKESSYWRLEDIFGSSEQILDTEPQEKAFQTDSLADFSPIEEIFASAPISELEEISKQENLSEESELNLPSLEDIFGDVSTDRIESISSENKNIEEIITDSLLSTTQESETSADSAATARASLEELILQTQNIFAQLPESEPLVPEIKPESQLSEPIPSEDKRPVTKSTNTVSQTATPLSVRVDFNRLERMNNFVGELAINRNGLSLQNEQLQGSVKELLNRFNRFHQIANALRDLSDLMLVDAGKSSSPTKGDKKLVSEEALMSERSEFDVLEMDRYSSLYPVLQSLLEEMMQLEESVDDIVLFARGSNQSLEQERQMLTSLRDELMWARMLPLGEVLNRFPRVLRDLSTNYNKQVRLKLVGTGVLVDRVALEKLYDPLLHLLRNAFDHGIETPQVRAKQGKQKEGQIEIRAYHQGNQTIIEIKDDGGGLNLEKIAKQALKMGLATAEQLAVYPPERMADLIFEPGFSTAAQVSELSGRGVGLDVVRSQLRSLKGTVTVASEPGQGTVFTLRLPLTLTIAKLLVCLISSTTAQGMMTAIALPSDSIEEIVIPEPEQIKKSGEKRFLYWQGQIIPIYTVGELLEYRCPVPETFSSKVLSAVPTPADWGLPLLLLRRGQQVFALEMSRLVTEQELVIKPFSSCMAAPHYTYGCTILGDGTLIPVINGILLLEQLLEPERATIMPMRAEPALGSREGTGGAVGVHSTATILVVDDSAALRRTLALTLEKAGYRVIQARDGREALEQLQQSPGIGLVVCDVEMPNMNGFEFLGQRRRDPQYMKIPVAMLTSRSSEKHRQLATHLGASAYFTKPYIEQQFLTAISNIIEGRS